MLEQLHNHAESIQQKLRGKRIGILYAAMEDTNSIVLKTRTDILTILNSLALEVTDIPYDQNEEVKALHDVINGINSVDLVCKIVHGQLNRSGLFQSLCEALKKPYSGHDLKTDLLSQNKITVKGRMDENNILTPKYTKIIPDKPQELEVFIKETRAKKFVLKPAETNSSIGILFAEDQKTLKEMASSLPVSYGDYLVEEYIPGRIITIGVIPLSDNKVYTTPPLEYILESGKPIMDHNWKLHPNRVSPAKIPNSINKKATEWAKCLHSAVGARGITRSDFIITQDGEVFALEINTNVGLAKNNDVPTAFIASGGNYEDIVLANLGTAL